MRFAASACNLLRSFNRLLCQKMFGKNTSIMARIVSELDFRSCLTVNLGGSPAMYLHVDQQSTLGQNVFAVDLILNGLGYFGMIYISHLFAP
jgi:hypothetical protein